VTGLSGRTAKVVLRGRTEVLDAAVPPEVDPAVVADAVTNGDSVLVELAEGERPLVVGVLHTRRPREIRLKATTIEIEGEEEVLVRAGPSSASSAGCSGSTDLPRHAPRPGRATPPPKAV
jgi:hypothetical protein